MQRREGLLIILLTSLTSLQKLKIINYITMLEIKDLHVSIDGREILKGINLEVRPVKFMPLWVPTDREKAHWQPLWPGKTV